MKKEFSITQKIGYTLTGALLMGALWRIRGTHGWGAGWGLFTVCLVLTAFVYSVFCRKANASYLHMVVSATAGFLTAPAWGTLLTQTSGYFSAHTIEETAACTPLSGVFMMLCLGFGTAPLFLFMLSRLFSDRAYPLWKYAVTFVLFFALAYSAQATVSHGIIRWVQPEAVQALQTALREKGIDGSVYAVYMKHFADIGWAKKIPYGRNYFSEAEVISRAIAAFVLALFVRFVWKDKAGGKILFWGNAAFSVAITAANLFFVLKNRLPDDAHTWLNEAWSFWEYGTGFIAGLLLMVLLFAVHKKFPDTGRTDQILPSMPGKVSDILLCVYVFVFGIGVTQIRPIALRLDASDLLPILVYGLGGILAVVFAVRMLAGKQSKLWRQDPVECATKLTVILFAVHAAIYLFVGYGEKNVPIILRHTPVQVLMYGTIPLFLLVYLQMQRKKIKP